jgi:hypothetical protein
MQIIVKLIATLVVTLLGSSLGAGSMKTGGPGSLIVSYKTTTPKVTLKEPVIIEFEAKNQTDSPVKLDVGFNRVGNFLVSFDGPGAANGRLLQIGASGLGRSGVIILQSGKTYMQSLLLNRWIEFKFPGTYQIEVRLSESAHNLEGVAVGGTDSFRGTVEVLPEDLSQLHRTCESLSRLVEDATSVENAEMPALSLSYVNDPIAVPYLERVLHTPGVGALQGGVAVQGLARIGNDDAIRALISALDMVDNPVTSISAGTALGQIKSQTDDSVRKEMIQDALNKYEFKDGRLRKKTNFQ